MLERTPGSSTEHAEGESAIEKSSGEKNFWPITHAVQKLLDRNEDGGEKSKNDAVFNENILSQFNPFGKRNKGTPLKTIIQNSSGCVKPGGTLSNN
jgi:hypothetical protein